MTDQNRPEDEGDWSSPLPEQDRPQRPAPGTPPGHPGPPPPGPGQPQPGGYFQPQPGGYVGPPPTKVDNFLIPAILATIFCCLPTGIAAIVFAAQVNSKLNAGDVAGAQASAAKARLWTWISVGTGLIVGLIYFVAAVGTAAPV